VKAVVAGGGIGIPVSAPTAYEVSTDRARIDHDAVYRYLSDDPPWAAGMPRHLFDRAVNHSRCYGVSHTPTGEQDRELADVKSWWLLADSREARALSLRTGFVDPEPERMARWMALPNRSRGADFATRGSPT
jgi:hypothetical protein